MCTLYKGQLCQCKYEGGNEELPKEEIKRLWLELQNRLEKSEKMAANGICYMEGDENEESRNGPYGFISHGR